MKFKLALGSNPRLIAKVGLSRLKKEILDFCRKYKKYLFHSEALAEYVEAVRQKLLTQNAIAFTSLKTAISKVKARYSWGIIPTLQDLHLTKVFS